MARVELQNLRKEFDKGTIVAVDDLNISIKDGEFIERATPEQIEMAELTIEVCDGNPTFVEENVDYFVDTVGNYCPWSAELTGVEDFR